MNRFSGSIAILLLLPLVAACAGDQQDTGSNWSGANTYKVRTGHGDRVTFHVIGSEQDGFEYRANIRHSTRADPDALDRQGILSSASDTLVAKLCPKGGKQTHVQYTPNSYERNGTFRCNVR